MKRFFFFVGAMLRLCAQTPIEEATSTFSNLPRWTVADCVSPISGQYFISENDLIVRGAQPLPLPRNYLSLDQYGKGGWSDRNHLLLKARKVGNHYFYFSTHDTSGIPLIFGRKSASNYHAKKFYLNQEVYGGTLLNTAIGEIGGRTNLKNAYAEFIGDACKVFMPDGTVRIYGKKLNKTKSTAYVFDDKKNRTIHSYKFCLTEERLPNGNRVIYDWTTNPNYTVLKSVYSSGPRKNSVYAIATYNDEEIITSDGRKERIEFEEGQSQMSALEITGMPKELFTYTKRRIQKRAFSNGPYVEIAYNDRKIISFENEDRNKGKNYREWGQKVVWPSNTVKQITDGKGRYEFHYETKLSPEVIKQTEAIDPEGGKIAFQIGKRNFPKCVIYFDQNEEKIREIEYEWERGNLSSLIYRNREGKTYKTIEYEYDNKYNITKQILRGDHRGFGGCEKSVTEYQYNTKNLPIFKKEPSGKVTRTTYWKETTQPSAILVGDSERIYERRFFTYNEDHILIKQTIDDGAHEDPTNLKEVSYRKIKRIKPHRGGEISTKNEPIAALNLPGEISEYFFDSKKQQEVLLKRTLNHYDRYSRINQKQIFDSENIHQYTLHYNYDEQDRLIEKNDPLGQTTTYEYDEQNNCIKESHPYKNLEILSEYDEQNNLITKTYQDTTQNNAFKKTTYEYDKKKRKTAEIDELENRTEYTYNLDDQIIQKRNPDGSTWKYGYDAEGNCIKKTDGNGHITKTQYNILNQKTVIFHPDGTEESSVYNLDGTLATYIDQEKHITDNTYDIFGRKTKTVLTDNNWEKLSKERYTYKGPHLVRKELPGKRLYTYTYDGAGRTKSSTYGEKKEKIQYDTLGRAHKTLNGTRVQIKTFDLLDRPIEERDEDLSQNLYSKTNYEYDGHGNRKKISLTIDQKNSHTHFTYNALNRLIEKTDPLNQTTPIIYKNHPQYLQKITQHPDGTTKEEHFDSQSRLLLKRWMDQKGNFLRSEENTYDPNNNLLQIQITYTLPNSTTKQQTISYQYDTLNRKITHCESGIKKTTYTYTPLGNQAQITKPDGIKIKKTYDGKQRLATLTSSDQTVSYHYTYDERDRLKKVYDHGNLCIKRNYDYQDRLILEEFLNHYTIKKTYDLYDRETTLTYPDGKKAYFTYDPYHLKQIQFNTITHTYTDYDQSGHLLQETLPAGLGEQYHTYNTLGQETTRTTPYQQETYNTFDKRGNLLTRTFNNEECHYTYDALNQLLKETRNFTNTYTYDTHYNRHSKNHTPYTLNTLNQVTKTPQITLTYDPNGNPIQKGTTTYTYDALDRLTTIQTPTTKTTYTYDPFHRRLTSNNDIYIYDKQKEIGQIAQNTFTQRRVLNPTNPSEIDSTIYYEIETQPYIPLHSIDGNITALYTPTGDLHQKFTYTAFGEQTHPTTHPWTYQSKRQDPTGLIYFGSRYYDPTLGRFLTPDPAGYTDSYNTYAYLLNRPFYYQDPTGEFIIVIPIAIEAAFVIKAMIFSAAVATAAWSINEIADRVNNKIDGTPTRPTALPYEYEQDQKRWLAETEFEWEEYKKSGLSQGAYFREKAETEKQHTPDQKTINELIKEKGKKGVSNSDADTLLDWAKEYDFPHRDDRGKDHWQHGEHIHLGPKHVKIYD